VNWTYQVRMDNSQSHMFECILIGCKSFELLLSIVEAETLLKGINSNQSAFIGGEIYAAAQRSGGPSAERYHHCDLFYCGIALAGMLLNPGAPSCGNGIRNLCILVSWFYSSLDYTHTGIGTTRRNCSNIEVLLGIQVFRFLTSAIQFNVQ